MSIDLLKLEEHLKFKIELRRLLKKNPYYGFDLNEDMFGILMANILPSSYGNRVPNYFAQKLKLLDSNDKDRGDKKYDDKYYECKTSIILDINDPISFNIRQLRKWQDTNYIIFFFNVPKKEWSRYYLTNNQMQEEVVICKASACHGSKEANKVNKKPELAFSLKGENLERWNDRYKISYADLYSMVHINEEFDKLFH